MIYGTIALQAVIVLSVCAVMFRKSWGASFVTLVGKHSVLIGFLLSLGGVIGSLIYSGVLGFEPCELCWWQRVLLYPAVPLLGVALYKKDRGVWAYITPMAILASLIAVYHSYVQLGGNGSLLPCTAVGGACAKVYVLAFGYITIPTMSLTFALALLLIAYINRLHADNRHA